ncbi:thiosulfate sulfurtransferase/rhodanese-like domain-containing protein 2 [Gadus chalcogrammus]|uniref:thiosulfate sulfurtransferase/rhodanese-like domain-containing protein 2 n=1 Tax=Gadus chalcogrammus TaxID=1042646 RepID=UPI0024C4DF0A|nr:thiosulfate sulfurtransferase/rhodanese-like domain-containing protein 2 [Gadus chalcogrammus]
MASDEFFADLELETFTRNESKQEKPQLPTTLRKLNTFCRRQAFSSYVASKRNASIGDSISQPVWYCCDQTFWEPSSVHKHVARTHENEVQQLTEVTFQRLLSQLEDKKCERPLPRDHNQEAVEISSWLPDTSYLTVEELQKGPGKVLLYYRYFRVDDPYTICAWQKALCEKLHLTGKVRVSTEGINGTVGGSVLATDIYIKTMCAHALFNSMEEDDFKSSDGGAECFSDLRVGVYEEIVPMGVHPDVISYQLAGTHLNPEEFHQEVESLQSEGESSQDTVLLDCRNFYESKIGQFRQCLAPNIRKFSYFPEYVDQNLDLFRDKKVLMYCTGGIRCERASAYLLSKEVCKEVYQLKGGIHKYLERFPDGFYRGKLFVFDGRYAISSNADILSECRYCGAPWDQYQLCATRFCCQLVLSCPACRGVGRTACCSACQSKVPPEGEESCAIGPAVLKEKCECTDRRPRIPQDAL